MRALQHGSALPLDRKSVLRTDVVARVRVVRRYVRKAVGHGRAPWNAFVCESCGMPGCVSRKRLQCRRIVTPAMRQAAFKASMEALVNDPNAVEHIASITISQKQMNMTAEMHQASKTWLQQLHEWGLILKGAMAIEKGETMSVFTLGL